MLCTSQYIEINTIVSVCKRVCDEIPNVMWFWFASQSTNDVFFFDNEHENMSNLVSPWFASVIISFSFTYSLKVQNYINKKLVTHSVLDSRGMERLQLENLTTNEMINEMKRWI